MARYPFLQVDAFTDRPLGGNPCAVVFETDDLDAATMLAIAREMNLSETAFVRNHSSVADFWVRYFTPAEEIPLAGHPTIATAFALVHSGRVRPSDPGITIQLELAVGPIAVEIRTASGAVEQIVMSQKSPQFLDVLPTERVLAVFHLQPEDLLPNLPVQVVSTGTPQLMVPVRNLDALRRAEPDGRLYRALREATGFFSCHLFCLEGITAAGNTFARHWADLPTLAEDPFTGSATGGMGAYLWHYGLIERPQFVAEQGHWLGRPGSARVEVIGPPEAIETVRVGGGAAVILEGTLIL